jgi:hypothetical protein
MTHAGVAVGADAGQVHTARAKLDEEQHMQHAQPRGVHRVKNRTPRRLAPRHAELAPPGLAWPRPSAPRLTSSAGTSSTATGT